MITGTATFPGMKDSFDQLDHIWQVIVSGRQNVLQTQWLKFPDVKTFYKQSVAKVFRRSDFQDSWEFDRGQGLSVLKNYEN